MKRQLPLRGFVFLLVLISCGERKGKPSGEESPEPGSFAFDVAFMQAHKSVLVLGTHASPARVLVVKDYQGRVMTSSAGGDAGTSYGWVNYDLIKSGAVKQHMNPYGGEDRFWLGPEGGQYALYFKKGDPFDYAHWQTPALIDTEPFDLVASDSTQATFKKSATVTNFKGTTFQIDILRQIKLLTSSEIESEFGFSIHDLKAVSFHSLNVITNAGSETWTRKNGLLSIWILGMFNPSPTATVILPHHKPGEAGGVTDNYFGVIPSERIVKSDSFLLMKSDGLFRGKVGIAPAVARNMVGSYDAKKHVLTLVKFDLEAAGEYVNSKWEIQKQPYGGDAVNAYNDGPLSDGGKLGSFYELESSSPVKELRPGESLTHRHITLHLEGDEDQLNRVAEKTLGVSLPMIQEVFKKME